MGKDLIVLKITPELAARYRQKADIYGIPYYTLTKLALEWYDFEIDRLGEVPIATLSTEDEQAILRHQKSLQLQIEKKEAAIEEDKSPLLLDMNGTYFSATQQGDEAKAVPDERSES